jgi:hypothetical protein
VVATKPCIKCFEVKRLDEFYPHKQMADGHLNMCKVCSRKEATKFRNAHVEQYRAYDRKRGWRPPKDYFKVAVRRAVRDALANGTLKKMPCEVGSDCRGRIEAHHDDYDKPLDVRWLCKKHHAEVHTQRDAA